MFSLAKRAADAAEAAAQAPSKRARLDLDVKERAIHDVIDDDEEDDEEEDEKSAATSPAADTVKVETATDITERFIFERLTPEMTAGLVLRFMVKYW